MNGAVIRLWPISLTLGERMTSLIIVRRSQDFSWFIIVVLTDLEVI